MNSVFFNWIETYIKYKFKFQNTKIALNLNPKNLNYVQGVKFSALVWREISSILKKYINSNWISKPGRLDFKMKTTITSHIGSGLSIFFYQKHFLEILFSVENVRCWNFGRKSCLSGRLWTTKIKDADSEWIFWFECLLWKKIIHILNKWVTILKFKKC